MAGDDLSDILAAKGEPLASEALARGTTHADAAAEAGISVRTLHRRLQHPTYREHVKRRQGEYRGQLLEGIVDGLLRGAAAGVGTLLEISEHGTSESARVSASRILIEHSLSFSELIAMSERLAAVEAAVDAARQPALPADVAV